MTKKEYPRIGETVFYETLENGMRVAIVKKPGFRRKMAFLSVGFGSADMKFSYGGNDYEMPAGTAHFLEHKMFEREDGADALSVLAKRGATGNAFTSTEMTAFHFDCTEEFYENLETLLDFVMHPGFTEESVEKEKPIIAQEIVMGEDDPDSALYHNLLRCLFRRHPIREPVVGTVKSIREIDAEKLMLCHRAFYVPRNMQLVLCGDLDEKEAITNVARLLPGSSGYAPKRVYPKEGPNPVKEEKTAVMDVAAPIFLAGAKTESGLKGSEAIRHELVASLSLSLLMGEASPLYARLYGEGVVNETFGYDFESANGVCVISFGGETDESDRVIAEVMREARNLGEHGLDTAFFERRKKSVIGDELRGLSSFDGICYNVACAMCEGYDYFGLVPVIMSITEQEVRDFLLKYVTPGRFAVSVISGRGDNK